MHLFLFVVLLASFVHRSTPATPEENEVFVNLKNGFPDGTLLTVYVKHILRSPMNPHIYISLNGDCSTDPGCLIFRLQGNYDGTREHGYIESTVRKLDNWVPETAVTEQIWQPLNMVFLDAKNWWRFDLYKVSDKLYLPFYQGFNAVPRTKMDSSTMNITSVRIRPAFDTTAAAAMNFDKNDVYVTIKHRKNCMVKTKPEMVMEAFNKTKVEERRLYPHKPTHYLPANLPNGFPEGKKIRLSALMMANKGFNGAGEPIEAQQNYFHESWPSIEFINEAGDWGFAIRNVWHFQEGVKFWLFTFNPSLDEEMDKRDPLRNAAGEAIQKQCNFGSITNKRFGATSTDLVHLKLWRKGTIIKMRVYYTNGKVAGDTCELDVGKSEPLLTYETSTKYDKFLDKPLNLATQHSAMILHMSMV